MTAGTGNRCLACMEPLDDEDAYHPVCSRRFFGSAVPPRLEYRLDEMDRLASQVIRTHTAVPGVQAKISLDLEKSRGAGKASRLTLVELWGQFILKPPTKQYPSLPELEAFTMHLANAAGIRTVPHALIKLKSGELAYITRRIDREGGSKRAMEDMCQLTGRLTEDKYKGSLEQIGKAVLLHSTQSGLDAINFFETILFCFLTGNADMHLKNFSLWRPTPDEIQLSPVYDLVATKLLLPKDSEESALAVNGKKKNLRRKDFDALALSLEVPMRSRENAYAIIARTLESSGGVLVKSSMPKGMKADFRALLKSRCKQLGFQAS